MKRFFLFLFAFVFGLGVVSISLWRSRPQLNTLTIEGKEIDESSLAEERVLVATISAEDVYPLPYPGILPDHPLYFIKMIRDRVRLWLTRDALTRAELFLHYADKRLAASLALAEQGKIGLSVSTASKGELYFEQALAAAEQANEAGRDTVDFWDKARQASVKYRQVLVGVRSRTPPEAVASLEAVLDKQRQIDERLNGVLPE